MAWALNPDDEGVDLSTVKKINKINNFVVQIILHDETTMFLEGENIYRIIYDAWKASKKKK